jgi:predicted cupin superfamily sugar epimerase
MNARERIETLGLEPHPEGGFYKRTYCSESVFPGDLEQDPFPAGRPHATAILYLMEAGDFAAFHRIRSDESWHFHEGGALQLLVLHEQAPAEIIFMGPNHALQVTIPANHWFAAVPAPGTEYCLVSCTVSPGFHFNDHEMACASELIAQFPDQSDLLGRYCRP